MVGRCVLDNSVKQPLQSRQCEKSFSFNCLALRTWLYLLIHGPQKWISFLGSTADEIILYNGEQSEYDFKSLLRLSQLGVHTKTVKDIYSKPIKIKVNKIKE